MILQMGMNAFLYRGNSFVVVTAFVIRISEWAVRTALFHVILFPTCTRGICFIFAIKAKMLLVGAPNNSAPFLFCLVPTSQLLDVDKITFKDAH